MSALILTLGLLAVVQTPIVGLPGSTSWEIGTWSAIECTFSLLVALTPGWLTSPAILPKTFSCWNGRRLPRSKIEPRST